VLRNDEKGTITITKKADGFHVRGER
jgi:hypothetical protein